MSPGSVSETLTQKFLKKLFAKIKIFEKIQILDELAFGCAGRDSVHLGIIESRHLVTGKLLVQSLSPAAVQ